MTMVRRPGMTDEQKRSRRKTSGKPAAPRRKTTASAAQKHGGVKKAAGSRRGAAWKKPSGPVPAPPAPAENPAARALAHRVADLVLDRKASDVVVLDVRGIASYADYVVIASGESDRQVTAMAEHVQTRLKEENGVRPIGAEGAETGHWVLLDFGDVVAHLFYDEVRAHYDLEGLWADAPKEMLS
jgi:ribosome-associated protein